MNLYRFMFVVVVLLLSGRPVFAQEGTQVVGRVTTQDDGLSVPGAEVLIPSLNLAVTTDQDGRYTIPVPAGLARGQVVDLRVTFPGLVSGARQVRLEPGTIMADFALRVGFTAEVTVGSRAPGAEAQRAVPIDLLTSEQIEATGASETMQVIQMLAPSFNFPRPTISDGTDSVRPATLRGLGPDQVLVLINGKRRHQTALIHINSTIGRGSTGVDLNAIPVSAIERIEILRDGAAAQYGSDAIAGVINIVLKSGVARPTLAFRGGGNVGAFTDVLGTEHDFTDGGTSDVSGTWGISLGPRASLALAGEFRDRRGTNRAGPDTGDPFSPQPNIHWGDSEEKNGLLFANADVILDERTQTMVYAFGGWSRRTGSHGGNYRRRTDAGNLPAIYPNGFLPLIEPINVDASFAAGVRGLASGWAWDASGVYGHNRLDYDVRNSLNVSLGPTIPPNQTEFYSGAIAFNELTFNGDLRRQVDIGLARPANLAVGVEYRRDTYQIVAGEVASYVDGGGRDQSGAPGIPGAQVFPGFRPSNETDASRNSVAAYIDLEGDVTGMLRVGGAGRWEHFDDFGNTGDGKLTARLQPHKRFLVRGAVSTGFRAPSLGQIYFSTVSTNFVLMGGAFVPVEAGTFPVASPQARALGATDLIPEESIHYSTGVVINTNPRRVIDPQSGLTKLDLVRYYDSVADWILPHLKGRPVALVRGPTGITGQLFFQKHGEKIGIPGIKELDPALWPGHDALLEIDSKEALLGAAQMNTIEFHTWNSTSRNLDRPNRMVFDLDPGEGVGWKQVQEAAQLVHALLEELGLKSWLKTSGGKGLHVVVPIAPRWSYDAVKDLSQAVVVHLARTLPDRFVAKSGASNRVGRIFVDYLRNGFGATTATAFSARARPGLGVSMPVAWEQLPQLKGGAQWTVATAREHLSFQREDPWAGYAAARQSIVGTARRLGFKLPAAAASPRAEG